MGRRNAQLCLARESGCILCRYLLLKRCRKRRQGGVFASGVSLIPWLLSVKKKTRRVTEALIMCRVMVQLSLSKWWGVQRRRWRLLCWHPLPRLSGNPAVDGIDQARSRLSRSTPPRSFQLPGRVARAVAEGPAERKSHRDYSCSDRRKCTSSAQRHPL